MIRLYDFDEVRPEEILNRDICLLYTSDAADE